MQEPRQAAAGAPVPASSHGSGTRWWVSAAPRPDLPHRRDRAGAQKGLVLAIAAAALFWLLIGLGVVALVRHG